MPELLLPLLAPPTALFSALLLPVIAYWLFVILGVVDIDLLGGADGADGILDAADGAIDAADALDGAADALDGAADAAHEAYDALEGSGDGAVGLLQSLKLRSVPLTVSATFLVFYSWLASLLLTSLAGAEGVPLILALGAASVVAGVGLTSITVRPLSRLFVTHEGPRRQDFIGGVCTVSTSRVDASFGQADLADGGAGLILQIRCDRPNQLTRGSEALLVHFDRAREAYVVEPLDGASARNKRPT